jgi:paraquat-inducible protein A
MPSGPLETLEPHPPTRLRAAAGATIVVAALTLGLALALPTVRFKRLASEEEIYSILGGIQSLWQDRNFILAAIVFVFSVAYPIAKLLVLCALWLGWSANPRRKALLEWLMVLGKWSLLDVFIIALFVGAIQLGFLAEAESRAGIHVFFIAIVLSILATHLLHRIDRVRSRAWSAWPAQPCARRPSGCP